MTDGDPILLFAVLPELPLFELTFVLRITVRYISAHEKAVALLFCLGLQAKDMEFIRRFEVMGFSHDASDLVKSHVLRDVQFP